jgi:hypothetical protein
LRYGWIIILPYYVFSVIIFVLKKWTPTRHARNSSPVKECNSCKGTVWFRTLCLISHCLSVCFSGLAVCFVNFFWTVLFRIPHPIARYTNYTAMYGRVFILLFKFQQSHDVEHVWCAAVTVVRKWWSVDFWLIIPSIVCATETGKQWVFHGPEKFDWGHSDLRSPRFLIITVI